MARPSRKKTPLTQPLRKAPVRIGHINTGAIIGELRKLHETAEDKDISRMPADGELFQALLYLESHAGALKDEEARRRAAVQRVTLWEYLREQADLHQAKSIEQARAEGVEWAELAPALAVNSPSAAYNMATRLRAAALNSDARAERPVRRTPEAVIEAERRIAEQLAAERQAQDEQQLARAARRHELPPRSRDARSNTGQAWTTTVISPSGWTRSLRSFPAAELPPSWSASEPTWKSEKYAEMSAPCPPTLDLHTKPQSARRVRL
ncbi:hypothetical protein [Streptomyces sp. WAC 05379]|uniref:hypothetical protein n=1 Tax=Streptomyces sp. WAC 05379 TaxID=2203207 RepID=UPI000F738713|nr:hypothetical protein [Streptomyces sp. WAC 05379]